MIRTNLFLFSIVVLCCILNFSLAAKSSQSKLAVLTAPKNIDVDYNAGQIQLSEFKSVILALNGLVSDKKEVKKRKNSTK